MSVFEKLMQMQTKLKAPKSQVNKFGNYRFRSCEDILEAAKPILKELGATITLNDAIQEIGGRFYVQATAIFTDAETAEAIVVNAFAREEEVIKGMSASQVTGATSSYARKYALNGLLAIDDTKDSDATNDHGKGPKPDPQADMPEGEKIDPNKKIEAVHISHIKSQLKLIDRDFYAYLTYKGFDKATDITLDDFTNDIKPELEDWVKKHKKAAKK